MKEERENSIKSSINGCIVHPFSSSIKDVCLVRFFSQCSGFPTLLDVLGAVRFIPNFKNMMKTKTKNDPFRTQLGVVDPLYLTNLGMGLKNLDLAGLGRVYVCKNKRVWSRWTRSIPIPLPSLAT